MMRVSLHRLTKLVVVESPNKVIKVEGLLSSPKVISEWSFGVQELRTISEGPEKVIAMATTGHFMSMKELTWTPQLLQPAQTKQVQQHANDFPSNGVLASFALEWEILRGRNIQETLTHNIQHKARDLSEIIVATDPDREGELIAVHTLHLIRRMFPTLQVPFTRAYIHSITEEGVRAAMRLRRTQFDHHLANAAEARHAMDRIFGFLGSTVVRFANPNMRSIGRVQTPALILISEREERIRKFVQSHKTSYEVRSMCHFPARNGTSFAQVVTIRPAEKSAKMSLTGEVPDAEKHGWESEKWVRALAFQWRLEGAHDFRVLSSNGGSGSSRGPQSSVTLPPEPFTMATLISRANHRFHLSSESVSACLQDLFQMGHITYPRTDSSRIDETELPAIYDAVRSEFGKSALYTMEDRVRAAHINKSAAAAAGKDSGHMDNYSRHCSHRRHGGVEDGGGNVEDAHEAIRPTKIHVKAADLGALSTSTKQVYELIRQNTLAAFMKPMKTERVEVSVHFTAGNGELLSFELKGKHVTEVGWSAALRSCNISSNKKGSGAGAGGGGRSSNQGASGSGVVREKDEVMAEMDAAALAEGMTVIPSISDDEFIALVQLSNTLRRSGHTRMRLESWQVAQNKPSPPLPFTEGGLIEELKKNGVGRPSTYPTIASILLARNYITIAQGRCETTEIGRLLVETSRTTFPSIVEIGFTASFEKKLDRIAKPTDAAGAVAVQHECNLTEADYVLSCFISRFLNYVTEATRLQRASMTERRLRLSNTTVGDSSHGNKDSSKHISGDANDGHSDDSVVSANATPHKHEKGQVNTTSAGRHGAGHSHDEAYIEDERKKSMVQVPDLAENMRSYRTFTALQNSLTAYLRRYFPSSPVSAWVRRGDAPTSSSGSSSSGSSTNKAKYTSGRRGVTGSHARTSYKKPLVKARSTYVKVTSPASRRKKMTASYAK